MILTLRYFMSLYITSLNSGSNGNCYYAGNEENAVLIDAGISCRETEKRMKRLGLSMKNVKAIFISHEHSDHINGIATLAKKYQLPIYVTEETQKQSKLSHNEYLLIPFSAYKAVQVGNLTVTAFPKFHDAIDPHSFIVASSSVRVGIFTDIGAVCKHLIKNFKECHAAFLESNYDEKMLANGSYPYHLKKRISGGQGHLSNVQALQLVMDHKPAFMSHLILSHLSKNNNDPELVQNLFSQKIKDVKIIVASRYEETPVYFINHEPVINISSRKKELLTKQKTQLSLF
jgi:phosphoribosyl 1,2-cyclic phosphodiesterase